MYRRTSCSVQNDIGFDLGLFILKPLQPFASHCWVRNRLSLAICAVIGFLPVFCSYICTGDFFITLQQKCDIRKSTSSNGAYFEQLNLLRSLSGIFSCILFSFVSNPDGLPTLIGTLEYSPILNSLRYLLSAPPRVIFLNDCFSK